MGKRQDVPQLDESGQRFVERLVASIILRMKGFPRLAEAIISDKPRIRRKVA